MFSFNNILSFFILRDNKIYDIMLFLIKPCKDRFNFKKNTYINSKIYYYMDINYLNNI